MPPNPAPFCPQYHPIHSGYLFDPSGPLLDETGLWHVWEDEGSWSHWTSPDLIHWSGALVNGTGFTQDTGSISPTPSGTFAFWPIMDGASNMDIASAKALTPISGPFGGPSQWEHRNGSTIKRPPRYDIAHFRDPARAFEYAGKWWVGVGCGSPNNASGGQVCLFEASDSTLSTFSDVGPLFTTSATFGTMDKQVVWHPTNGVLIHITISRSHPRAHPRTAA